MATVRLSLTEMYKYYSTGSVPLSELPENIEEPPSGKYQPYYCRFSSVPSQYNSKKITSVKIGMSGQAGKYDMGSGYVGTRQLDLWGWFINEDWGSPLNAETKPIDEYREDFPSKNYSCNFSFYYKDYFTTKEYSCNLAIDNIFNERLDEIRNLLKFGYWFKMSPDSAHPPEIGDIEFPYVKSKGSLAPYIEIEFSNTNVPLLLDQCSPTSGYQSKRTANTYSWSTKTNDYSLYNPSIAVAKFRYRANSSSAYTEINCGSASSYTMPPNTISSNSFQWQVAITDANGNVSTSDWYTISTQEVLSSATIIEPKNVTLDGASSNRFEWNHIISTGTAQTKADLQYSTNGGSSWVQFATPTGSATFTTIPANTFSAGSYLWRVRTYNTDNSAGSWSDEKPFTVIAKPTVRAVTSEQNPKPKISWQSTGQQAYRVYIDGLFDSGVLFGTNDNYSLPIYLEDGSYTVKVIVQNSYGLWSDEGSAPIVVNNVAGTPMVLSARNSSSGVVLDWTAVLSYAYYVVYRDGIAIARIRDNTYTDYVSLGEHSYFIRGIYASTKNYGISNTVSINAYVNELTISDLETFNTISIELNDSSYADIQIADTIKNTTVYISSSDYPINETSHFKSKTINFSCAFIKRSELENSFRNMLGNLVCIKTKAGTSIVGNLLEQYKTENEFYVKYRCTLNQTNYEEEIQL